MRACVLFAFVSVGCTTEHVTIGSTAPADQPPQEEEQQVAPALTPAAPAEAPYPKGYYGGSVGDVMPNFTVKGYALSREHRDSTDLPLVDISLGRVRAEATGCSCMVVVWNSA